jgi:hypothetical protein
MIIKGKQEENGLENSLWNSFFLQNYSLTPESGIS